MFLVPIPLANHAPHSNQGVLEIWYFGDEAMLWHTNWTFTAEAGAHCVSEAIGQNRQILSIIRLLDICFAHVVIMQLPQHILKSHFN